MSLRCRVCGNPVGNPVFSEMLLGKKADYFDCSTCGYVQTQEPTWLELAYASAINKSDTGIMLRNLKNVGEVLAAMSVLGIRTEQVVDCGAGYGILVRLLRDRGVDALWSDRYCENLIAKGFEHKGESAGLVTAFEVLEHFVRPKEELERFFAIAPNVLFSTELISFPAPRQPDWWYYAPEHGQHIGFFRVQTLSYLASQFGKYLISDGRNYHLMTDHRVSALRWRLDRLIARHCPCFLTCSLVSRVWSDFEQIRAS
jgi:hypothetical protein